MEIAVEGTFGPDARFEFFGSAVNGFETSSSVTETGEKVVVAGVGGVVVVIVV